MPPVRFVPFFAPWLETCPLSKVQIGNEPIQNPKLNIQNYLGLSPYVHLFLCLKKRAVSQKHKKGMNQFKIQNSKFKITFAFPLMLFCPYVYKKTIAHLL